MASLACLSLVAGTGSLLASEPGAPGTATPQPYVLPAPAALPANPERPPLLRLPPAQQQIPRRDTPLVHPVPRPKQPTQPRHSAPEASGSKRD